VFQVRDGRLFKSRRIGIAGLVIAIALSVACGGASENGPTPATSTTVTTSGLRVSEDAVFDANCGRNETGTLFTNAEVEPHLAINPARPANLIATWQQDRWSNGAARGVVAASSMDGGATWVRRSPPFSRCAGGPAERASDPWVSIGPTGIAHLMALTSTGGVFGAGSQSGMMMSRSTDGGLTWSTPVSLIQDTVPFFNDKNSVTADPFDPNFVYAAWDRLEQNSGGPAYLARSVDAGVTWEGARAIYDPGRTSQIIGAEVVITNEGHLLYFFTRIDAVGSQSQASVTVVRSHDRGRTFEAPVTISRLLAVGTRDPDTQAQVRDGSILMHAAAGPGVVVVAWQDGRFSNGARDGVAFSQSRDGGRTWSEPLQVNAAPAFAAFTPQPQVSHDGVISVGYFDLRANTSDRATLPAQYWLARSTDGVAWSETRVAGPFNLTGAPNAGGTFVGDYAGLVAAGPTVLSLLALSGDDVNNRTDIFYSATSVARAASVATVARGEASGYRALPAPAAQISSELSRRASDVIAETLQEKLTIHPRRRDQ
jgi:hypothetical protein